jgi:hypothetical protein
MGIFKSKRKKAEELFTTGARGAGTVVQVQDTGTTINDNPRIKMVLRVEPLDGSPAFDATKTTTVSRVQIPRQGDRYPVWYDPQDTSKWAYPTIADDTGRETIRQQFGDAADTFVGMGAPAPPAPRPRRLRTQSSSSSSSRTCTPRACSRTTSSPTRRRSCWVGGASRAT